MKAIRRMPTLTPAMAEKLVSYTALDHPIRWRAYDIVRREPNISFNGLARRLKVDTGLAAYHVAVLKAAKLIDVRHVRQSKVTSQYFLTDRGQRVYWQLTHRSPPGARKSKRATR
jgi:DNA-binding MarR family transcriptional regulator